MFDPSKFFDNHPAVLELWMKNRTPDNRDELPIASRVARIKAEIADGHYITDDKINVSASRLLDELQKPSMAARIDAATPAAEEEAEEDKDRLIVRPDRGGNEVEDGERWDADFDGARK